MSPRAIGTCRLLYLYENDVGQQLTFLLVGYSNW